MAAPFVYLNRKAHHVPGTELMMKNDILRYNSLYVQITYSLYICMLCIVLSVWLHMVCRDWIQTKLESEESESYMRKT